MTSPVGGETVTAVEGDKRVLVVMRHARAETFAREDRLRALTARGLEDAAAAGSWIRARGVAPDAALVSSAVRARQTWAAVAEAAGCPDLEASFEDALFSAGTDTVLECLRTLPDTVRTAVFVGHNPTAGMLVQVLGDGGGDQDAITELGSGFPPGAVAVLSCTGSWADLDHGTARLVDVLVRHG